MKKIKWKLLLMLLILGLIALSACASMPVEPHDPIFQPIVDQKFCQPDDPENCEVKSLCREYRYNAKNEYELFQVHPLKKCSGTFAQDIESFNRKKDFIRALIAWVKNTCEAQ